MPRSVVLPGPGCYLDRAVTDLEKWKLHGPVAGMQGEVAEWDRERQQWHAARHRTSVIFDRRGRITQLDQPGAEGSVHRTTFLYDDKGRLAEVTYSSVGASAHTTTVHSCDAVGRIERVVERHANGSERTIGVYEYDASGRKKKTEFLPGETPKIAMMCGVEGSEVGYGVPGAASVTTLYDDRDRPVQAVFHDASHTPLRTVTFTRDTDGRVVTEDARMAQAGPAHFEGIGDLSADDRAQLVAMVGAAFGSIVTTFAYDSHGRLSERRRHMGTLGDEYTTFGYDHHGNVVHERTHHQDREMRLDENGAMETAAESVRTDEWRFEYTYDRVGNWTERVVNARFDPHAEFQRSNVERRTIQYYED